MVRVSLNKTAYVVTFISVCAIFAFSMQPGEISYSFSGVGMRGIEWILGIFEVEMGTTVFTEFFIRKCAHVFLYAFLGLGVGLVVSGLFHRICERYQLLSFICSIVICTICGGVDEYIQSLLLGRGGKFSDVYIDAIGYILGIVIALVIYWFSENQKRSEGYVARS